MTDTETAFDRNRTRLWLLGAIALVVVGWALHATGAFVVPVVFSIFLALLVAPLDRGVANRVSEKLAWLGHAVAMSAILVALLIAVAMISFAAQQAVERFHVPEDSDSLLSQFGVDLGGEPGGTDATAMPGAHATPPETGAADDEGAETTPTEGLLSEFGRIFSGAGGSLSDSLRAWGAGVAMTILRSASTLVAMTVLVFFLTLLMLIEGPKWQQKIANLLDVPARQGAMESIRVIGDLFRRYLLARTVLGLATAALYAAWLWIFGIDLLVVWALVVFLLNYIPTLGSLIGGVLPVLYAFAQKDFGTAMAVGAGIFVIEQVMGNYVDPRVQGRLVSVSPLVVLITLLVWGWVWGIAGAILAVPITIAAMIICAHVGPLRPFALMLSNETDMDGLDRQTGRSGPGA